ncbi:MAG TPA: CDP-alcohol phosphatidyltransferase family protein [Rhodospirillales bacterium]|nr:CDP-alcohol phosphatidyltransferase family protein [Rhodospirillales bacterium]
MNIPNFISLARLALVPLMVWLVLSGELASAFWVFVAAGVSDAVDGFIAKRFDMETELGKYLDPIADKAMLVSVYISLGQQGLIQTWLVILVVFRDVLIIGGALLFQTLTQSLFMQPLMISKVNTLTQIVLAALILGGTGMNVESRPIAEFMVYVVAATTVMSGVAYVITWTRRAVEMEEEE